MGAVALLTSMVGGLIGSELDSSGTTSTLLASTGPPSIRLASETDDMLSLPKGRDTPEENGLIAGEESHAEATVFAEDSLIGDLRLELEGLLWKVEELSQRSEHSQAALKDAVGECSSDVRVVKNDVALLLKGTERVEVALLNCSDAIGTQSVAIQSLQRSSKELERILVSGIERQMRVQGWLIASALLSLAGIIAAVIILLKRG